MSLLFILKVTLVTLAFLSQGTSARLENQNETERVLFSSNIPITADRIQNEYIVQLRSNSHLRNVKAQVQDLLSQVGISNRHLLHTYSYAMNGFTIRGVSKRALLLLRRSKIVQSISPNVKVYPTATQANPTWNLDRIDQVTYPLSKSYLYNATGSGVRVFILDTGIKMDHDEFKNDTGTRVTCGFTVFSNCTDIYEHGTHVAGLVGGKTYGVAKNVDLVAVKVLSDRGPGSVGGIIAGIDYVIKQKTISRTIPMVINMSLGATYDLNLNKAVKAATDNGIVVVVAAGNYQSDACKYSPASEPSAITVGATERNSTRGFSDPIASYSNQGSCVDIFAPGTAVRSAGVACTNCSVAMSGTSISAPHVTGVAAQYLQSNPTATPSQVWTAINDLATLNNVIGLLPGTPNVFLRTNL